MAGRVKIIVAFLVTLTTCSTTLADRIITVDNDGPADFNNIQAAIDDSNDGDTIYVTEAPYAQWTKTLSLLTSPLSTAASVETLFGGS